MALIGSHFQWVAVIRFVRMHHSLGSAVEFHELSPITDARAGTAIICSCGLRAWWMPPGATQARHGRVDEMGLKGLREAVRPASQPRDVDAVRRVIPVRPDVFGASPQQRRGAGRVATCGVGQTDGQLRQTAPQRAFGLGRGLPGVLEHFVGMEGHPGVQQPLSLDNLASRALTRVRGGTTPPAAAAEVRTG